MLSIIIPIYNAEKTLKRCLDSLKRQMYNDYEVILIDDGSTDSSGYIARCYTEKDSRFVYVLQKNAGPGAARNHGLELAIGEYIIFVDADDWLEDDYLSIIMAPENDEYDAVIWGFTEEWNDREQIVVPEASVSLCNTSVLQTAFCLKRKIQYGMSWNCRFRKNILYKHKILMPVDVKLHEDCIFTNWYFQHASSLKVLPYSGYHYIHLEGESLCRRKHYPSDETYSMALQMYRSVEPWIGPNSLGKFEIYNYISKLSLSVLDMYKKEDMPRKSWMERLQRISFVKSETCRYYTLLEGNRKKTHYIFRYLPTYAIDLVYKIMVK